MKMQLEFPFWEKIKHPKRVIRDLDSVSKKIKYKTKKVKQNEKKDIDGGNA
nr:MAG: hypothetical protein [Microviridae sp.]